HRTVTQHGEGVPAGAADVAEGEGRGDHLSGTVYPVGWVEALRGPRVLSVTGAWASKTRPTLQESAMPPPGHEPLLNAILRQPEDDVVRLVYADWLEENGAPARAEFIRVQCRLATLGHGPLWPPPPGAGSPAALLGLNTEAAALTRRQAELWAE